EAGRSISHDEPGLDGAGRHPVILGVAEFALGNGVSPITKISTVESQLHLFHPIANPGVHGGEGRCEGGVALVEIAIAGVVDRDAPNHAAVRSQTETGRTKLSGGHLHALAAELSWNIIE